VPATINLQVSSIGIQLSEVSDTVAELKALNSNVVVLNIGPEGVVPAVQLILKACPVIPHQKLSSPVSGSNRHW
jgi:hypothetical protein